MSIFRKDNGDECEAIVLLNTKDKNQFVSTGGDENLAASAAATLEKSGYNVKFDSYNNVIADGLEQGTVTAIGAVGEYLKKNDVKFYTETQSKGNGKHFIAFFKIFGVIVGAIIAAGIIYHVAF